MRSGPFFILSQHSGQPPRMVHRPPGHASGFFTKEVIHLKSENDSPSEVAARKTGVLIQRAGVDGNYLPLRL
jgi:hypothetical protein